MAWVLGTGEERYAAHFGLELLQEFHSLCDQIQRKKGNTGRVAPWARLALGVAGIDRMTTGNEHNWRGRRQANRRRDTTPASHDDCWPPGGDLGCKRSRMLR